MRVIGVDGCPGGWLAVAYDDVAASLTPRVHTSFAELVVAYPDAACIGIDIPIGLASDGPRPCDIEARRVLGPRRSSVFPAPDSRVLEDERVLRAASHREATKLAEERTGKGISQQTLAILSKIAEVNQAMTPALQRRVVEVHPEVSFWALAGRAMAHHKRSAEGFEERRALLAAAFDGVHITARTEAARLAPPATADDVLDAVVIAWTARRHAGRRAGRLAAAPPLDQRGLRMEIVF